MERNIGDGLAEWIQRVAQTDGGNLAALRPDGPVPSSLHPGPLAEAAAVSDGEPARRDAAAE
eukprot:8728259-Lingulodinium_polyedra.AAC.1